MNLQRYFLVSSYALLTVSLLMLAATRQIDGVSLGLYTCTLVAGVLIDTDRLQLNLPTRLANGLLILWLLVALAEWQLFRLSPVLVIVHFVLFASALKLLRRKSNRDWIWLYLVSFCHVLMSAGLMLGTKFLLLLVLYLFAAISTFVAYQIRSAQQAFQQSQSTPPAPLEYWREEEAQRQPVALPRWRNLTYFSASALLLILLLATPIFLAMPRVSRGMGRSGLLPTEALSGFSDTVRLGEVAQVKLNPQIVMRVRVKFPRGESAHPLRWRGVTLDLYDGQSWNTSGEDQTPVQRRGADNFHLETYRWPPFFTEQHFFVEPLNINTVFAAPRPYVVSGLPDLTRDEGDGLWTEFHPFHKLDYTVYSYTVQPSDTDLMADSGRNYPPEVRLRYLQLPNEFDPRIGQLAAELTRGVTSTLEIAQRIEQHLRNTYSYSLELQPVVEGDPVADFLFNTKAGHCEYFASAMVLLLRSRRVAARLVNGFQMGEYNAAVDVYTVRQSDAHSWVEVFFPQHGWVAFDPTPAAGLSVYDDGWLARLRKYGEAMEMFWFEHIIGFDTNKQISLALSAQRWLSFYERDANLRWLEWTNNLSELLEGWRANRRFQERLQEDTKTGLSFSAIIGHPATLLGLGLFFLGGVGLVLYRQRHSWRWRVRRDAAGSAVAFYEEMLRLLARAGQRRESHETPVEFAAQVGLPAVTELTNLYQQTRFGAAQLTDVEIERVAALLRDVKAQTKRRWRRRS
ncbi:MAG: DUF3488 domain-containing protein [Acidobacteria bacterium]|nr:DUF3488 domain-containing protein [Acidobacteriota bacterium]